MCPGGKGPGEGQLWGRTGRGSAALREPLLRLLQGTRGAGHEKWPAEISLFISPAEFEGHPVLPHQVLGAAPQGEGEGRRGSRAKQTADPEGQGTRKCHCFSFLISNPTGASIGCFLRSLPGPACGETAGGLWTQASGGDPRSPKGRSSLKQGPGRQPVVAELGPGLWLQVAHLTDRLQRELPAQRQPFPPSPQSAPRLGHGKGKDVRLGAGGSSGSWGGPTLRSLGSSSQIFQAYTEATFSCVGTRSGRGAGRAGGRCTPLPNERRASWQKQQEPRLSLRPYDSSSSVGIYPGDPEAKRPEKRRRYCVR